MARYDEGMQLPIRSFLAVALVAMLITPAVQARKSKSIVQQVVDAYVHLWPPA